MHSIDERDMRFRNAIRQAVEQALNDGITGPAIIHHLEREAEILIERLPQTVTAS